MSKTYQLKMTAPRADAKTHDATPAAGKSSVMVQAQPGARYQLTDVQTGFAPDNIRVSRSGKHLRILVDGQPEPAFVIENFYDQASEDHHVLTGKAEDGNTYAYIPESASTAATVAQLQSNGQTAGMALGGAGIAAGAAVGMLAPVAVFNPMLLAAGALGAAALAGGGGGSSGVDTSPSINITDISDDTGFKNNDFVTMDNTLIVHGKVKNHSATDKVRVQILNGTTVVSEGEATISSDGKWTFDNTSKLRPGDQTVANELANGTYSIKATLINASATSLALANQALTIDNSAANNSDGTPDPNRAASISIRAITRDTGHNPSDFHTSDTDLTYTGQVSGFQNNEDQIRLQLKSNGAVVATQYVTPDANNQWTWQDPAQRIDGNYILEAVVVDLAGNEVTSMVSQLVRIDTSTTRQSDGASDPNSNATTAVTIDGISEDTGSSPRDFYTSDNTPTYFGQVKNYTPNGDLVQLVLTDSTGQKVEKHVIPDANGNWTWPDSLRPDGIYTLAATLVDPAGNAVRPTTTQSVHIDTSTSQNTGETDLNATASLNISALVLDATGVQSGWADFYNNAPQSSHFKGTLSSWANNGDQLHLEVFTQDGNRVAAEYVQVKDNAWSSDALLDGWNQADGKYILRATVEDLAGNTVLVDTQAFVIDQTHPLALSLLNPGLGLNEGARITISGPTVGASNFKTYEFTGEGINTDRRPDTTLSYTVVDYAGNSTTGNTGTSPYTGRLIFDKSNANARILPPQEVIDMTGDITFKVQNAPTTLDLTAVIRENAPKVFNALDLNDGKPTNVTISLRDLLDTGLTNCFTVARDYKNDIQFKIKGDSSDIVTLNREFTTTGNIQLNLEGVSYNVYHARSGNIDMDLFIQTSITQVQ